MESIDVNGLNKKEYRNLSNYFVNQYKSLGVHFTET